MYNINDRIKQVREALGLSQNEFAIELNLRRNTISLFENGKRNPSDRTLNDICSTFSVNKTWLESGEEEMFINISQEENEKREKLRMIIDAGLSLNEMNLILNLIKEIKTRGDK